MVMSGKGFKSDYEVLNFKAPFLALFIIAVFFQ